MVDLIIIIAIVAYCAWVIYTHFFKKSKDHCNGICAGCSQCSSPFEDYRRDQKKLKEKHLHG